MPGWLLSSAANSALNLHPKRYIAAVITVYLASLWLIYYQTVWSTVSIWVRSETFAHGFLILPIVLWMCWGKRNEIYTQVDKPEYRLVFILVIGGFVWFLANLVDVLVVQQFALVTMMVAGLWGLLGSRACKTIAFPLAYLFFLVPVGGGLIPYLMEFTATFTVALVKLVGIPVYREGLYFYLPSGNWSVIEACSGIRYLIASVTLGTLYAYLTYRNFLKRAMFIAASIIVPIIANGVRAFAIVMIGHLSDMELATGLDHLIYGWIFFGIVMFILFALGNIWREDQSLNVETECFDSQMLCVQAVSLRPLFLMLLLFLASIAIWPLLGFKVDGRNVNPVAQVQMPEAIGDWRQLNNLSGWRPKEGGAEHVSVFNYVKQGWEVQLVFHQYSSQVQGGELVPGEELLITNNKYWRIASQQLSEVLFSQFPLLVRETRIKGAGAEDILIWNWYRVGDKFAANPYWVKVLETYQKLIVGRQDSVRIYLVSNIQSGSVEVDSTRRVMREFVHVAQRTLEKQFDMLVAD